MKKAIKRSVLVERAAALEMSTTFFDTTLRRAWYALIRHIRTGGNLPGVGDWRKIWTLVEVAELPETCPLGWLPRELSYETLLRRILQ